MEDHVLLELYMKNGSRFYICKDLGISLAIRLINYEDQIGEEDYWRGTEREPKIVEYIDSHTITFQGVRYVIEEEISYIHYTDDYIELCIKGIGHDYTAFIPYNEISFFTRNKNELYNASGSSLAEQYNKLLLELREES